MMTVSKAFEQAKIEGLSFFWVNRHVGGTSRFVGQSWEEGGFTVDEEGNPVRDSHGNTIAKFTVETLDESNPQHFAQVEEWYNG